MAGGAGGAIAGILVANNKKRLDEGIAAARESWKALAAEGLEVFDDDGRPALRGTAHGVAIEVWIVNDVVYAAHTRVEATAPEPKDAKLGVHPQPPGVLGRLRSLIGQDLEIGDEELDRALLITAKPASAAKSMLSHDLRELLRALVGHGLASFEYEQGRVTVQLSGVMTDVAVLHGAVALAALAACWGG